MYVVMIVPHWIKQSTNKTIYLKTRNTVYWRGPYRQKHFLSQSVGPLICEILSLLFFRQKGLSGCLNLEIPNFNLCHTNCLIELLSQMWDVFRAPGPSGQGQKKFISLVWPPCCYKPIFLNGRIIHITELKYAENVTLLTSLFMMLWVIFITRDKMKLMSCHFVPPIWSEEQKKKKTQ